jgi:phosphopantetheinyl transferase
VRRPNGRVAFFRCWTRKEAYIKARGEGLSLPLDQFDVSLVPGEQDALLGSQREPSEASSWLLQELASAPGDVAALAVARAQLAAYLLAMAGREAIIRLNVTARFFAEPIAQRAA